MALVVGTNSWVTVAEADIYLTDRIGSTEWFGLLDLPSNPGEDAKETMLISAFYWLIGSPELNLTPSLSATNVKNAQIEAALFLLEHYDELNERRAFISAGGESFKLSKRSEDLNLKNLKIPPQIAGLIPEYGINHAIVDFKGGYDI